MVCIFFLIWYVAFISHYECWLVIYCLGFGSALVFVYAMWFFVICIFSLVSDPNTRWLIVDLGFDCTVDFIVKEMCLGWGVKKNIGYDEGETHCAELGCQNHVYLEVLKWEGGPKNKFPFPSPSIWKKYSFRLVMQLIDLIHNWFQLTLCHNFGWSLGHVIQGSSLASCD